MRLVFLVRHRFCSLDLLTLEQSAHPLDALDSGVFVCRRFWRPNLTKAGPSNVMGEILSFFQIRMKTWQVSHVEDPISSLPTSLNTNKKTSMDEYSEGDEGNEHTVYCIPVYPHNLIPLTKPRRYSFWIFWNPALKEVA